MRGSTLTWLFSAALFFHTAYSQDAFDPRTFTKRTTTCRAIRRLPAPPKDVDISLSYVDINPEEKTTLLMVHGWPGLWSTWARQIEDLQGDYRLIVPDLRGFGESTHPVDVRSSGMMGDFASDLVCILENAGVQTAACIGHDWGSQVCHEAARMRPDIFNAVVGLVVPYVSNSGPFIPVSALVSAFPRLTYQLYFDNKTDKAIAELNKDIRRSIRATLRTVASPPPDDFLTSPDNFLGAYANVATIPPVPFFSQIEEDYFIEQYNKQGFNTNLEFYTTDDRLGSWQEAQDQGNFTVPQPALSIFPVNDPVADWLALADLVKLKEFVPKVTFETVEGAHWVHLENPEIVNQILRQWLLLNVPRK